MVQLYRSRIHGLCADRGKLLQPMPHSALGYRSPEEFENESDERNGDAGFGAATMKGFRELNENLELGVRLPKHA